MAGLDRELKGLEGDKKLSKLAVESSQNQMAEMLKGKMGQDMMQVLNGEKTIDLPISQKLKFKIGSWFRNLLRKF